MDAEDASRSGPGSEASSSTTSSVNDLPPQNRCDICDSLSHLPSLLNLAQASLAFTEPASSHVRTLQALDDLPGRAWQRFTCADGLKLLLNLSQQQQRSQLWQHTLQHMPARVRRCIVANQQAAYNIATIGSIIAAGLAASACASHLQQLTIDAPVSTSEASQLMALLASLQRLELNQLRCTATGEQQGQRWCPAHLPQGLLHLHLQGGSPQYIQLDARPFAAARALQSLQLLENVQVHSIAAFTALTQLTSLSLSWRPGTQLPDLLETLSKLQALRHVSLPWCTWHDWPSDIPQLERLHVRGIVTWPEEAVSSIRHLTCDFMSLELPQLDGCLTQALPALEVLQVTGVVLRKQGLNALCRALSCHTALRSLRLPCEWRRTSGVGQPWPQQGLASISSLTQLQVLNLLAVDVPDLLHDIATCTALRELQLGLAGGTWPRLGEQCRQQLRALRASSSSVRRCTIEGLGDE